MLPMTKDKFFDLDLGVSIGLVILLGFINPLKGVLIAYLIVIGLIIITRRTYLFYHLLLATIISSLWLFIAHDQYGYGIVPDFNGINLFPAIAWSLGLFGSFMLFSHIKNITKIKTEWVAITMYLIMYWMMLVGIETIGYYYLDIQNLTTAQYPGLPFCNCMHAPPWMQLAYFLLGPIFFFSARAIMKKSTYAHTY